MTPSPDAASAYRQAAFDNAPPLKILRMLYQGAIRFLNQARELDPERELDAFKDRLARADAILVELRLSLEHGAAPELSANLERLYLFVEGRLSRAQLDGSVEPLAECVKVLETLLDGWQQVELGGQRIAS